MKCPDCNGSGKVQLLTSAKECATCGGNGEVIADADMQTILAAEKVNGGAWHGPTLAVDNTTVHHGGFHHFDAPGSIGILSVDECREAECPEHRQPIDVTGKPTPPEIIRGVYGQTHFDIKNVPMGTKVFLNGVEVKKPVENDLLAGWVRAYEVDADGDVIPTPAGFCRQSIFFGKVEMVKPIPHSGDLLYKSAKLPYLNEETWAALGLPPKDQINCESITVDPIPGTMQAQVTVAYRFR